MQMIPHGKYLFAIVALCLARPGVSSAQSSAQPAGNEPPTKGKPPTAQSHPNNPELWNVDAMMEEAVLQISRRYNLSRSQEEYTRLLLTKRTRQFLELHEAEVRELLKESIDLRIGTKPATIEAYVKWAARAAPLYQEASKAILEGNEEWREILDDVQKKTHDGDMALMRSNFNQVSKTMEDWQKGNTPVGKSPHLVEEAQLADAKRSPKGSSVSSDTPKGGISTPPVQIKRQSLEDSWLAYVNKFIDAYQLDEKQAVAARDKIHKDSRESAGKVRDKLKSEFEKLESDLRAADSPSKSQELAKRRKKLEKPLRELFVGMDRRLNELPDSKQRTAVTEVKRRDLEALYESLAGEPRSKSPPEGTAPKLRTVGPSSQSVKDKSSTEDDTDSPHAAPVAPAESSHDSKSPATTPSE